MSAERIDERESENELSGTERGAGDRGVVSGLNLQLMAAKA